MPWGLKRYQQAHHLHFITFSCYNRASLLGTRQAREVFEQTLEQVRLWYGFCVAGYVVMPEHVHFLVTEPQEVPLSLALQMLKQNVSGKLHRQNPRPVAKSATRTGHPFWEQRYYDFNVWSEHKKIEKLRYIHRNPVARGLVNAPEDWAWSSFRHYVSGAEGVVEIESQWTARKREQQGIFPKLQPVTTPEK